MIVAFSVTPLGVGDSVGDHVAACVRIVRESGLETETNAMFTNVAGEWDEVMPVVRRCVDHLHDSGVERVSVVMKMDSRRGEGHTMAHKVARVG